MLDENVNRFWQIRPKLQLQAQTTTFDRLQSPSSKLAERSSANKQYPPEKISVLDVVPAIFVVCLRSWESEACQGSAFPLEIGTEMTGGVVGS